MGAVYKANHPSAKPLAIKVLHPEFAREPKVLERFFNEAEAVNKINQPHIVDISDKGYLANGQPFIAMEFLEGMDLSARLGQEAPIPQDEALDVVLQVLEALSAAHGANIIHRDMKPENIFLLPNKSRKRSGKWFVKVLDFGIAKLSQANSQQTQSGTILGTPKYMSPEQARGEREIGPAADLYSLGIILYELITGKSPFDEPSYLGYLVAHQRKVPPAPREVNPAISEELESIVMKCLEKAPNLRFTSAQEMHAALEACFQKLSGGVPARVATPAPIPAIRPQEPVRASTLALQEEVKPTAPAPFAAPVAPVSPAPFSAPASPAPFSAPAQAAKSPEESKAAAAQKNVDTRAIPAVQEPKPSGSAKWIAVAVGAVVVLGAVAYVAGLF
jgi:serine/threonine-protein kinase